MVYYLSSYQGKVKNDYYEKVEKVAEYFTKCVYSEKLKKSENNKLEELYLKEEEALKIQYDVPLIFKTKNGYEEISISDNEIKDKNIEYFLENLKKIMSSEQSIEDIKQMLGNYKITKDNYKKMVLILP